MLELQLELSRYVMDMSCMSYRLGMLELQPEPTGETPTPTDTLSLGHVGVATQGIWR